MPPETEKKGFGAKLKGVGKAIGRQLKKVPGVAYRDVVKPYAQHMADKFTEVGPGPGRPISGEPQTPYREGDVVKSGSVSPGVPTGLKRRKNPPGQKAKILPAMSAPATPIAEQVAQVSRPAAKDYGRAGGRTGSYSKEFKGSLGAVGRLNKQAADERAKTGRRPMGGGNLPISVTTAAPLTDRTKTTGLVPKTPTPKGRTKKQSTTRGSVARYKVKVDEKAPKKTSTDVTYPRRKQTAGTEAARKKKTGKRKFSPKRTAATLEKAAEKRREDIAAAGRIDTSATDMARILTEQEVGREAERAEAALKQGRKPKREKARYRYRTRGYKRSEGRGR